MPHPIPVELGRAPNWFHALPPHMQLLLAGGLLFFAVCLFFVLVYIIVRDTSSNDAELDHQQDEPVLRRKDVEDEKKIA